MFFNRDDPTIYRRAHVYRIKFISFRDTNFSVKTAQYDYIADYDFLKVLEKLANTNWSLEPLEKSDRRHKLIILLDLLPTEIKALLKLNNNLVYVFKSYFNDNKLDKLAKD